MTILLTHNQQLGIAVAQKVSSSLSILGSSYILWEVLSDPRKRSKVFYRLLFALSVSDIFSSTAFFIGTWAVPQGTPGVLNPLGTHATCQAQAFFVYASIIPLNFNACLALYYLLSIRYGWKERNIRTYVEPLCYMFAIGLGFAGGLFGLLSGVFGPANFWCSIQPSVLTKNTWLIWYIPAWIVLCFVTVVMIAVYVHVLQIEKKLERYNFAKYSLTNVSGGGDLPINQSLTISNSNKHNTKEDSGGCDGSIHGSLTTSQVGAMSNSQKVGKERKKKKQQQIIERKRKQSQQVAMQAMYYCLAFYLTLAFPTMVRSIQALNGNPPYALKLLHMIFLPLQGFMNFLVYMRLRWGEKFNHCRDNKCFGWICNGGRFGKESSAKESSSSGVAAAHQVVMDLAVSKEILDYYSENEDLRILEEMQEEKREMEEEGDVERPMEAATLDKEEPHYVA